MAQQKSTGSKPTNRAPAGNAKGAAKANASASKRAVKEEPRSIDVEKYTVKPEFWESILDSLPPWGDEIAAILLIVFGVVSFLSLLNASPDATISAAWSKAITGLFGWGSILVSAGIFALGVILLLPKLGVVIRFPTRRILALEIAFLSSLALLHLLSGEQELKALARAGQGGGQVGWALSVAVTSLFGTIVAIVFYSALLLLAISIVAGVRSAMIRNGLRAVSTRLTAFAMYHRELARAARERRRQIKITEAPDPLGKALQSIGEVPAPKKVVGAIVRIRRDPDTLPPSLRPGALTEETPDKPSETAETPIAAETHPLFQRREILPDFNVVGTVKGKKTKDGVMMVERPDGRLKRYFTVEGMKEPKGSVKRPGTLPPLDLLRDAPLNLPHESEINTNVVLIENTLLEFDIDVDVVDVKVGPTVTQYAVQPFREMKDGGTEAVTSRTRVSKIASLSSDLALALSAKRLRLETPVPGHSYIGIEVPNKNPSVVALRSVYESKAYVEAAGKAHSPLLVPLGRDVAGQPFMIDLATMPHLLVAGTTGSGKSVAMAAIATALILANQPDQVKLIMLDPKMVELSRFNGIPHLLGPVETDQERVIGVLRWCTREMDRRYRTLEEAAARNIDTFNQRLGRRRKDEYMPYIVIIIDEIGDLMLSRPEETEKTITRLAQMARAVGMHMIVATQRPSVDVITGLIKANFPSRISFAVASGIDSRVILDASGAETLIGRGDMLFHASDAAAPRRIQGCFVSDDEVRAVVEWWRDWQQQQAEDGKVKDVGIGPWERGLTRREFLSETDPMLEQAITLVVAEGEASASLIQRRLGLGYPRAARIMDLLVELGVVGEQIPGARGREVLIKDGKDPFKELIERRMKGQEK